MARLEEVLATTLAPTRDNPLWQMYAFELKNGAFKGGEFRRSQQGERALLTLTPRDPPGLTAGELDTWAWGRKSVV